MGRVGPFAVGDFVSEYSSVAAGGKGGEEEELGDGGGGYGCGARYAVLED